MKKLTEQHLRLLTAVTHVRWRLRELLRAQPHQAPMLAPLIDLLTSAIKARSARAAGTSTKQKEGDVDFPFRC